MVEGGGFEPPKAEPADLQSAPFGHSGTPPNKVRILYMAYGSVNSNTAKFNTLIYALLKKAPINSRPFDIELKKLNIRDYFFASLRSFTSLITCSETFFGHGR